jgi:TetR/AcrR family transcriptional regulator, cholesterol catabolism regulator
MSDTNPEKILACAKDLFFKYGLRNVTMDDISHELGMSKKTLYASFDNKQEIVNTITRNFLKKKEVEYFQIVQNSENAIQELMLLMSNLKGIFEQIDFRLVQDMQRYYPEAWEMFEQHKRDFMHVRIVENLKRGSGEELYRSDFNIEIIAKLRLEEIQWSLSKEILPESKYTLLKTHNEILMHFLYGIVSTKGLKMIKKYTNNEI